MGKLHLLVISLIVAGMAVGCSYKTFVASADLSGDAPRTAANQSANSIYLLGVGDELPDSSSLLADVTIYSPLFWMESWDSPHSAFFLMLERARKEAQEMGGNAIQVLDCSAKKFARCKILARVYFLSRPPIPRTISADSCIVHIKINADAGRRAKPVPVNINDSLIGVSNGVNLSGRWHIDHDIVLLPRIEQFTLESTKGGWLYSQTNGVRYPYRIKLEKGTEYYVFVHFTSPRVWTQYYFSTVTREEFEMNRFLY